MAKQTYNAALLTRPREISLQPRAVSDLGRNEVDIHVAYAGVCGTDIAVFSGEYVVPLPLVPGHEFTGYVAKVGADVSSDLLGKLVTAEINNTCLSRESAQPCAACRRGFPNHCLRRTVLGIVKWDGAFSERVRAPFRNVHLLPKAISPQEGVFVEPLAAAIQTFELSPLRAGDLVVVLGAGRLGTLLCAVAKEKGAKVVAVDADKSSLQRAAAFGADLVLLGNAKDALPGIKSMTEGLGADIVVDATGSPKGLSDALSLVRPRGTVALKTTCGIPSPALDATRIAVDEIAIQGSRCGPFPKAIEMMAAGRINVSSLISAVVPLEETAAAIEIARTETKVLIQSRG